MSRRNKCRNRSALRYRSLVVMVCIALAPVFSGCSDSDDLTTGRTLAAGQPFYRFVDSVEEAPEGLEVKARVGSDYRNVLFALSDADPDGHPIASYVTPVVEVPATAKLDFGIGLESPPDSATEAVSFSVTAVTESGREVVYEETLSPAAFRDKKKASWVDVTVNLSGMEGETARFEFEASDVDTARWANPVLHATGLTRTDERPNIIFISLDTLRADHLGSYGYERDTSPNLDRLAKEGVLFEECFSPTSWTTPSHATAFTGLSPLVHGAGTIAGRRLRDSFTTISEVARNQGYITAAYTEGAAVGGQLGFHQGFDRYSNGPFASREDITLDASPGIAGITFGRAQSWLDQFGHLPFALFVHTYEIHWPYAPPEEYANRFTESPVDPKEMLSTLDQGVMLLTNDPKKRVITEALYDGGIAYTDSVVGEFFSFLDTQGHLDNTIVILFSDHGEAFWEHGLATHGTMQYREVLHVPLYIRLPKGQYGGTRVKESVALADIFPTAIELLGFDFPSADNAMSLTPLFHKDENATYSRQVVGGHLWQDTLNWLMITAETEKGKYIITTQTDSEASPLFGYTSVPGGHIVGEPELRLVNHLLNGGRDWWTTESDEARNQMFSSAREELFLSGDPKESEDKSLEEIELLKEFRAIMRDYISDLVSQSNLQKLSGSVAPLTDEEKEELRAIGYIVD